MSNDNDSFDPYYTWLSIQPAEQPPNHYRLLGVSAFEDNADVISNAADQRMVYVRTFQFGQRSVLSQKILNEISAAKICLLDRQKKAAYDRQLQLSVAATPMPPPQARPIAMPPAPAIPVAQPPDIVTAAPPPIFDTGSRGPTIALKYAKRRSKRSPLLSGATVCATLLLIGSVVFYFVWRGTDRAHNVAHNPDSRSASSTVKRITTAIGPAKTNPSLPPQGVVSRPPAKSSSVVPPPKPAETERTLWRYEDNGKTYQFFFADNVWQGVAPLGRFRFKEITRNEEYIELLDDAGNFGIRIYADHYELSFRSLPWNRLNQGRWISPN